MEILKIEKNLINFLNENGYQIEDLNGAMELIINEIAFNSISISEAIENWFHSTLENYPEILIEL